MHLRVNGRSFTRIPISLEGFKRRKGECVGQQTRVAWVFTLMRQGFRFPSHTDWTKDAI